MKMTWSEQNCRTKTEPSKNKPDSLVSQREPTVSSQVLLIAFNLSLIQRAMEFALKYEAKSPGHAHNRRQLHLFTEQKKKEKKKKGSAFISAADSVSVV